MISPGQSIDLSREGLAHDLTRMFLNPEMDTVDIEAVSTIAL